MCGLAGVFGINNFTAIKGSVVNNQQTYQPNITFYLKRNLSILLHISQLRGQDSSGVFLSNGKDQHTVVKDTCTSSVLINTTRYERALSNNTWDVAIGHSRAATVGGVTFDTAHPHVYGSIMLVHNGTIRNHTTELPGAPSGVSDSAAIAWTLNELSVEDAHTVFAKIENFGAVIWYDLRDMSLNVSKDNSRTLFWTRPPKKSKSKFKAGYISSQKEALGFVTNDDCPRIEEVPSFTHFKYKDGEMKLFCKWEEYKKPPTVTSNYSGEYWASRYSHYAALISQYVEDDGPYEDDECVDEAALLDKGSRIRVNTVLDLGANRPLKTSYRDPLSDTVFQVFIDQPPLSLFKEYELLLDQGGVVEIKYVHGTNIYTKVCEQPKHNIGVCHGSK